MALTRVVEMVLRYPVRTVTRALPCPARRGEVCTGSVLPRVADVRGVTVADLRSEAKVRPNNR